MIFSNSVVGLASLALVAAASNPLGSRQSSSYDYIVVGSGAGGGPLAARLALAGKKTLLIDAGNDQGNNPNYTVPAYQAKSTEDPEMAWDFFVRHYSDETRQAKNFKTTYTLPDGSEYVGLNPPAGAKMKGILYPRTATLGGCTAHNALVFLYPDRSDFQYIADLTGDLSWSPDNMRNYLVKAERNTYLAPATPGHGYFGWLSTSVAPITIAIRDSQLVKQLVGAAQALGGATTLANFYNLGLGDANADSTIRDQSQGLYQIPISSNAGQRNGARDFIMQVYNARNADCSQTFPLTLQLNTLVTKVVFDRKQVPPRATGVEWLVGRHIYRADKLSSTAAPGVPGGASANREVIVAGGSYNSPQILKLSGVGPRAELESLGIDVVADLPGVGNNLQDHYEISVQASIPNNYSSLNGCNFAASGPNQPIPVEQDPCYQTWKNKTLGDRGSYASSGFAGGMFIKTSADPDNNYGLFAFGGPVNFRGYFPGYAYNGSMFHNWWSWAIIKAHPRNNAGTVKLVSKDPLDVPAITYNYFDTGSGDYAKDLSQITQAIGVARTSFAKSGLNVTEILPGAGVQSQADLEEYVKNVAWGHHASSTCAIGADGDPNAVLDSSFRVRKVQGLRVVDASVYPKIPGTFTAASTYLVGEKAADVILSQNII